MRTHRGRTIAMLALTATLTGHVLPSAPARAQAPESPAPTEAGSMESRLPATIGDHPTRVLPDGDLGAWIEAAFPGETHPEFDALDAALAAQGAARSDVRVAWAWAGEDTDLQIAGFQLPGGDAQAIRDAILGVYLVGLEPLIRTEQEVAGRPVMFVSQGPLESDSYPFGVVIDGDVVWIASGDATMLRQAVEALILAATGAVPRLDPSAVESPGYTAPWGWDGTVSQTITWDQGSYRGTSVGRHTGSWLQPPTLTGYCERDCQVYVPTGTIDWSWDVSAPTTPPCSASTRGSLAPGDVVTPTDQMLYLDPTDDGHVRFWGSGSFLVPDQPCVGWEADRGPGSFLEIPPPEDRPPSADELSDPFPSCNDRQWRITDSATRITGRCWQYHEPGYEDVVEWDLVAIEQ
ncbi:MAG: hypothetical protein ABWZ82_02860 [Candidatus Limnocylindrales bacterium]